MSAPQTLRVWMQGIGMLAPGLANWQEARACLRGEHNHEPKATVLPEPTMLPPAERRRASRVIKLALAVGSEAVQHAGADAAALATVFTSSTGDGHNCHALCETLATPQRDISPTRFHNSVHNTAAGYWCIACHATGPCQVLAAHDASFAAGLLEAAVQVVAEQRDVLLLSYDAEYPEPLHSCRPVPDAAGVALVLGPKATAGSLFALDITWQSSHAPAAALPSASLNRLHDSIPAMRALPLLQLLAHGVAGSTAISSLPDQHLQVEVQPCN